MRTHDNKDQSQMKDTKRKIEVAYFWNKKDDSKIDMIMTKTQKLLPEENFIKATKKMIRQIKKLGWVDSFPEEKGYTVWKSEVLKIVSGGDIDDNRNLGTKVERPRRSRRKTQSK